MKPVSPGQILEFASRLTNQVRWEEIDGDRFQEAVVQLSQKEFGDRCTAFLKNDCRLMIGEAKMLTLRPFEFAELQQVIGTGWTIWKGLADGKGLEGEEAQDKLSLTLPRVDFSSSLFESCLKEKETTIKGEEKLKRLMKSGHILHGGNVFLNLWRDYKANGENSVLEWLWRNRGIGYMDFFGLVLRSSSGRRCVLYLYRDVYGRWFWRCYWLVIDWFAQSFTSVSQVETQS